MAAGKEKKKGKGFILSTRRKAGWGKGEGVMKLEGSTRVCRKRSRWLEEADVGQGGEGAVEGKR